MRFTPKTETEVASSGLWPKGEYDFEVVEAVDGESKAGNDMTTLRMFIFNDNGEKRTVFDYLVATEGGMFKVRHFAEATGLMRQYEAGQMDADDMMGRTGRCKVAIIKDKAGQYPDKNGVVDYVKREEKPSSRPAPSRQMAKADLDDEIPF